MIPTVKPLFKKTAPENPFGPPAAQRFFKIRSKKTGLYKLAGLAGTDGHTASHGRVGGWSKIGKTWTVKSLAGHFSLFLRYNERKRIWAGKEWVAGSLERPELEEGAPYYEIPEEYEVVEYYALGSVITLKAALGKKLETASLVLKKEQSK